MMDQAIRDFPKQFTYDPVVNNPEKLEAFDKFLVCAMGGSALASGLLQLAVPKLDIILHRDYGLPALPEEKIKNRLVLLISYSGNTEEVIDAYNVAKQNKLPMAVISKGGRLIELAEADNIPFIKLPDTGIQPRNALGFTLRAQLKLMGQINLLNETKSVSTHWQPEKYEHAGRALAQRLKNRTPIVYSSTANLFLAYVWKIKFNETGKIPAMYNVLPELNHNEMQGFYVSDETRKLSEQFYILFLTDSSDHSRVQKRMQITKNLYTDKGLSTENIEVVGDNVWHKIFASIAVADWAGYYLATGYGFDPEKVEMVEKFKQILG